MFFLGLNFLGADELTVPLTPTETTVIDAIELMNVQAYWLVASKDTTSTLTSKVSTEWDFNTILAANYNSTTQAGNINFILETISEIKVKRRIYGTYTWVTLKVQDVKNNVKNLNIKGVDLTSESLKYEYALVPVLNNAEGKYTIVVADVSNTDLTLIDKTGIYHTPITDGFCDTVDVHPNQVLELLHNKYPTVVRNTIANYETINVTGNFVPIDDNNCSYTQAFDTDFDSDRRRVLYSREVKNFLTNGYTKVLKNVDGQCWLVYVTTPPSDTADGFYNIRKLTFGCTETGDLKKEEDLFYAGLLDVPEQYWNTNYVTV